MVLPPMGSLTNSMENYPAEVGAIPAINCREDRVLAQGVAFQRSPIASSDGLIAEAGCWQVTHVRPLEPVGSKKG